MGGSHSYLKDILSKGTDLRAGTHIITPTEHYEISGVEANDEFPHGTLRMHPNGQKFRWYSHGKLHAINVVNHTKNGGNEEKHSVSGATSEEVKCIESYSVHGAEEIIDATGGMVGSIVSQPDVTGLSNDVLGIAADTAFLAYGGDGDVTTTADNIAAPTIDEIMINEIVESQ